MSDSFHRWHMLDRCLQESLNYATARAACGERASREELNRAEREAEDAGYTLQQITEAEACWLRDMGAGA